MLIEYRGARLARQAGQTYLKPCWTFIVQTSGLDLDTTVPPYGGVRPSGCPFFWVADFFIFRASPVCSEVNRSGTFRQGSGPDRFYTSRLGIGNFNVDEKPFLIVPFVAMDQVTAFIQRPLPSLAFCIHGIAATFGLISLDETLLH